MILRTRRSNLMIRSFSLICFSSSQTMSHLSYTPSYPAKNGKIKHMHKHKITIIRQQTQILKFKMKTIKILFLKTMKWTYPPEFNNEFLNLTEEDMKDYINGQQNKTLCKKTVRDIAMVTKFLKVKKWTSWAAHYQAWWTWSAFSKFCSHVPKQGWGEYEPISLRSIISNVDRNLKRMKYGYIILGEGAKHNDAFELTRDDIVAKQKIL